MFIVPVAFVQTVVFVDTGPIGIQVTHVNRQADTSSPVEMVKFAPSSSHVMQPNDQMRLWRGFIRNVVMASDSK